MVYLTDIYGAGEKPLADITSASFYLHMRSILKNKVHFLPRSHLESGVGAILQPLDVVLTIGAGDVTKSGSLILSEYLKKGATLKVAVLYGGESKMWYSQL